MNCLNVDFKIDGIEKAAGEFSDEFITHLFDNNEVVVNQTYRARMFLKFIKTATKSSFYAYSINSVRRFCW